MRVRPESVTHLVVKLFNRVFHGYPQCNSIWAWRSSGLHLHLHLPYDCLLHHIEDYAILIFVRHAQ